MNRDEEIIRMYVEVQRSLAEVASKFNLSRERVRQILVDAGISERHHGSRRRTEYEAALLDSHERITEGPSSVQIESENFGIKPDSLRVAFRRRNLKLLRKEAQHGTRSYYTRYCCQCDACLEANRAYTEGLKSKEPPHHGTASGYANYGCRCLDCRRAGTEKRREIKRKRLERNI